MTMAERTRPHICFLCGAVIPTDKGLAIHHGRKHKGEPFDPLPESVRTHAWPPAAAVDVVERRKERIRRERLARSVDHPERHVGPYVRHDEPPPPSGRAPCGVTGERPSHVDLGEGDFDA